MPRVPLALTLLTSALLAQNATTFHSETRLVQINVIVRDKSGPVANLTKDDFTIRDQGKPQKIALFSATSTSHPREDAALPENTFSNRAAAPSSVTVVLLDRLNTLDGAASAAWESNPLWMEDHALGYAKQSLLAFLKAMDSKDRVAIYSLGPSLRVLADFTGDRDQLIRIVENYRATSITSRETVAPEAVHTGVPEDFDEKVNADRRALAALTNGRRVEITMAALGSIAGHVAAIPGRKNLVWFTTNLPFSGVYAARAMSRAGVAIYPVDARGLLPRSTGFGGIDTLSGVAGMNQGVKSTGTPTGVDTMTQLAEETGGRAFLNTNDLAGAIRTAVDDAAVTYTLGFYPEAAPDGKFHELKVHVDHSGLDVRAPKGYFALKSAESPSSRVLTALENPLDSSEIHLLARVERVDPQSLSISGSIDLRDLALVSKKGLVNIYIFQQDRTGKVLDQRHATLKVELTNSQYDAYLKTGLFFREVVAGRDGAASLRVVVEDAASRAAGTLIVPLSSVR